MSKSKTKRFLGRELTIHRHGGWSCSRTQFPFVDIAYGLSIRVFVTMSRKVEFETEAYTERAARAAMVRKLRRLRDELSELEF